MQREAIDHTPRLSRWVINTAALLVPRADRAAWKCEWLWEAWHGHATLINQGATSHRAARRVTQFALGAFADAADLRREQRNTQFGARSLIRDPLVCIATLALLFLAPAVSTGGFRHSRAALQPSYSGSDHLVLLSRRLGVLGLQMPTTSGQVWTWMASSTWFGDVAGFVLHDGTLEVTPNFFPVLHTSMPRGFRFLGHSISTVKLLDPQRPPIGFSGALARLKNPGDRKAAEDHFARFWISDGFPVTTTFLSERDRWPFYFAGGVSLLFLGAGLMRARRSLPYTSFFAAKTGLLLITVAAAWTEVATTLPIPITGGVEPPIAGALVPLLLLSQLFVLRWSLEDQRSRCPVCCRLVSMPLTVGSRSSLLLDRPGIELLCTRGHGTLTLSDLKTSTGEPSRWTPADCSWRDLFVREKTA